MTLNTRHYEQLTAGERVRLMVAAQSRSDEAETERLMTSAPRCSCGCVQHEVMIPLRRIVMAGGAAIIALNGSVETIDALALFLAPAAPWPDFLDDVEFPRPTTVAREILNGAYSTTVGGAVFGLDLDDEVFHLIGEYAEDLLQGGVRRVHELVAHSIILAHRGALTALDGVTQWCDAVDLDSEAFLVDWCGDSLDRLAALRPVVDQAERILAKMSERLEAIIGPGKLPKFDPDSVDQDSSLDLMITLLEGVPSLDPAVMK